ncbi:hypothetical protein [Streptomyces albidoflavus]|uniref:hypothetical protein n=1 Tax=Streptomyces albidoflavus TaxID=1886 RepID=UPI0020D1A54D|nr:hypothetical protein [Streptomyces albidoflavus]
MQLDTAIGDDDGTGGGNTRLGLFDEADGMDEASVVPPRIENDGALSVSDGDYTSGGLHGMTATFDGREVHGVAVTVGPGSGALMSHFTPAHGLEYSGSSLRIPRVPLNKGACFKLLELLSDGTVGSKVTVRGGGTLEGVRRLSLDGRRPSLDGAGHDAYPYREIEYAYTYGRPAADSLAVGFLAFATRGPGLDVVRTHGHPPCGTPEGLPVCGAAD